jgi:ABC-type transporter Mla subunit MlaD
VSITIKLDTDASKTKSTLGEVKADLKDVKAGAQQAGKAIGEALGGDQVRKAQDEFDKLAAAAKRCTEVHEKFAREQSPLAQNIKALGEQLANEKRVLDAINKPMKEYMDDLRALDKLLERGKISTEQYAQEVTNLNKKLGEKPQQGEGGEGALGKAQGVMGFIQGGAAAGGLVAVAQGLADMQHEAHEMEDRFTGMANVALKFASNGRTVNMVLEEQHRLARELNADMPETEALYDGIQQSMRNMSMTTKEYADITRILGMEMVNQNKPVSEAGGLMQRLAAAMETGQGAGRAFKMILVEFPELADAAAKAFKTDTDGLADMVDKGKVKLPELTRAWVQNGDEIRDEFNKRKRSHADMEKAFDEDITYYMGKGASYQQALLQAQSKDYADLTKHMNEVRNGGKDFADVMGEITTKVHDGAVAWKAYEEAMQSSAAMMGVSGALGVLDDLNAGLARFAQLTDEAGEKFANSAFGKAAGSQVQRAKGIHDAKVELEALHMEMKNGTLTASEYEKRYEALMTTMNGGELPRTIKLWHEINDPIREYNASFKTLIEMNKAGMLSSEQFARGLKVVESKRGFDYAAEKRNASHAAEMAEVKRGIDEQAKAMAKAKKESDDLTEMEKERLKYLELVQTPQEKVAEELDDLQKAYARGTVDAELFARAQKKILEGLGDNGKALTEDWNRRLQEYRDHTKMVNDAVAATFEPIADAIGQMASGIETDWSAMIKKLLADMTKLLIMKAAIAAAGGSESPTASFGQSIGNMLSSGLAGHAAGTSFVVGGQPGTDKVPVAFRASPGERVTVDPVGRGAQHSLAGGGGGGGGQPMQAKIVNVYDAKQAAYEALNSRAGHDLLMNWVAKNRDYLKGFLVR